MKSLPFVFFLLLIGGCTTTEIREPFGVPSDSWTRVDCDNLIKRVIVHNIPDQTSAIRVFATPYYPSVIAALARKEQLLKHRSKEEFQQDFDQLTKESLGFYYDWSNTRYMDPRGNFLTDRSQFDSLLILVTIQNKTYPCEVPFSFASQHSLAEVNDWPCYTPVTDDLENRIFLRNDFDDYIAPLFVWGRKGDQLLKEETLFVRFPLHQNGKNFLAGSRAMHLVLRGFGDDIVLHFPLDLMQ